MTLREVQARRRGGPLLLRALLIACAAVSLLAPPAAALCEDYQTSFRWVSNLEFDGQGFGLTIEFPYAYVAAGLNGLRVFRIDGTVPELLITVPLSGVARSVTILNGYAYVASGIALHALSLENPEEPVLERTVETPGDAFAVASAGNALFLADGTKGLSTYDVTLPNVLDRRASIDTPGSAQSIAVRGRYAYVGEVATGTAPPGPGGFRIFEISSLVSPQLVANVGNDVNVRGVSLSGNFAYLACEAAGLRIYDISAAGAPRERSTLDLGARAVAVSASGPTAYVCFGDTPQAGLAAVNIQNSSLPVLRVKLFSPVFGRAIVFYQNTVYLLRHSAEAGRSGIEVYRSGTGNALPARGRVTPASGLDLALVGVYAYVAGGSQGLQIYDVTVDDAPYLFSEGKGPGEALAVAVKESYAYVASGTGGLQIYDVSDRLHPRVAGSAPTSGLAFDVEVRESRAYVADDGSGIRIYDISAGAAPFLLGTVATSGRLRGMALDGGLAYLLVQGSGFVIADISDPRNPSVLGLFGELGDASEVLIDYPFAYVGVGSSMVVLNVADPSAPEIVREVKLPAPCVGLDQSTDVLYAALGTAGVANISVTQPEAARLVSFTYGQGAGALRADAVFASRDYLFVIGNSFAIHSLQCPVFVPLSLTSLEARNDPEGIRLSWQVQEGSFEGFRVERAVGPDPEETAFERLHDPPVLFDASLREYLDLSAAGGVGYTYRVTGIGPDGSDVSTLSTFIESSSVGSGQGIWPNPSRPGERCRFSMLAGAPSEALIVAANGRVVARLKNPSGAAYLSWDGRDGRGLAVPSGVYWLSRSPAFPPVRLVRLP